MWSTMRYAGCAVALTCVPALAQSPDASSTDLQLNFSGPVLHRFEIPSQPESSPTQHSNVVPYNLAAMQDVDDEGDWGPDAGEWEFFLTGSGTSNDSFDTTQFSTNFSIGYFLDESWLLSLRQSIEFLEDDGTNFAGSTRGVIDYHFDLDRWRPLVGASFGGIYGDGIDEQFFAGLEGGVKWYVRPDTFILALIEFQWFFDDLDTADESFDDGRWVYSLGIGFNF